MPEKQNIEYKQSWHDDYLKWVCGFANAPSQAHLQGAQSRHTKPNLAKEPALCKRFRDTPYHRGHRLSIKVTKTKGEHTT
jgi:hypothetical protein